jgi:phage baseplate assembly protein W
MPVLKLANSLIERAALGRGVKFPLTIDVGTNDFEMVEYEEAIKESLFWLISTRVGERVMNEDIGTLVSESLFSDIEAVADVLPFQLAEAIARHEPRVTDVKMKVERTALTELRITITWVVRATGRRDSLVYPYYTEPTGGVT